MVRNIRARRRREINHRSAGTRTCAVVTVGLAAATMFYTSSAHGQTGTGRVVPTNETVISGYGTVGYNAQTQGDNLNAFTASVSPVFLFQFQDRVLFEMELEFDLREGVTETGLEYAQLDYILNDNVVLVAGKFLLPFGVFGPEIHPTWINKHTTAPPLYGHHVTQFGAPPLLPVLADVGAMARVALNPGRMQLAFILYATQGPSAEDADEAVPELEFASSSSDGNTDKMLGTRVDIGLPPWVRLSLSYLNGDYDESNALGFTAWNVAAEARTSGFEIRGEYIQTRQEIQSVGGVPTFRRHGFYAQTAYRRGRWEPVFRWTQIFANNFAGAPQDIGAWQAAPGIDYWLNPSIAFMVGYEINRERGAEIDNDRVVAHFAFGF